MLGCDFEKSYAILVIKIFLMKDLYEKIETCTTFIKEVGQHINN